MNFLGKYLEYQNKTSVFIPSPELSAFYFYNFYKEKNNFILIVTNTLFEANSLYKRIKNYSDDVFLFPADEFLASVVLAVSPDLKVMRLETLDKVLNSEKLIVVTHLMGYLKLLPNIEKFSKNVLSLKMGDEIERDEIINRIQDLGYIRTSMVGTTGEYALRGFIIDIYPIKSENPIRIELFGDTIESIREFDVENQRSIRSLDNLTIKQYDEVLDNNFSSLFDYLKEPFVFFVNKSQIMNEYERLLSQIDDYNKEKNLDDKYIYKMEDIPVSNYIEVNTINNYNSTFLYETKETPKFNGDFDAFRNFCDVNKDKIKIVICLSNDKQVDFISSIVGSFNYGEPKLGFITIIKTKISSGYYFKDYCILSEYDIDDNKEISKFKNPYKLGKKIKSFDDIKIGDYVVHTLNGIGVYAGIEAINKGGVIRDYIRINYLGNDKVFLPVEKIDSIYKYASSDSNPPKINKLGSTSWAKTKASVRKKIHDISEELISLYAKRKSVKSDSFKSDEEEDIFASQFDFTPTKDQQRCIEEILTDLKSEIPMDRLLCGDVGFGKTEVAFRAMFRTVINGFQVAYLCPTTILSRQQYLSALDRFKKYPISIALINRYTSTKELNKIIEDIKIGKIDIIIGTHKLLNKQIQYRNLGLLIIDEEQRFGVTQKEKLKSIKTNVNVLTLSATPIPRTLKMAMSGLRDLSIIDTPPINRYPVQTYVLEQNDVVIKDAIYKELMRNGQVFILHNKVETIENEKNKIEQLIPDAKVTYAHGRMDKKTSESIISAFIQNEYNVLICTTIMETGIDIPNVNTLIIEDADNFGLSQLYQLRGRVGRSDKIAYAYLMYKNNKVLNTTAVKRLQAIKEFTELGSGYKIAMRDLSIRGAGDLLGSEQAGFIDSVGIELYTKMVEDEIKNDGNEEIEEDFSQPLLEVTKHIDDSYVTEEEIKIEIHKLINKIDSEEKLKEIKSEIEDRFGTISSDMEIYMYEELFESLAKKLDIYKVLQNQKEIVITLSEDLSNEIEGDKLLLMVYNLNPKYRISYFAKKINITLPLLGLEKHFIYYEVKLLNEILSMTS